METIYKTLFSGLDFFAAPYATDTPLLLTRARALIATNLFVIIISISGAAFITLVNSLGTFTPTFINFVLTPCCVINAWIPVILRKTGWLTFCQQLTLCVTFATIIVLIASNGGPVTSHNNTLMILQAALAFFLLGIRGGLVWALLVLGCQSLLFILVANGVQFPNYQPSETVFAGAAFNWGLSFSAIVCLVLLIESSRGLLERQRHNEQERFRYLATHDDLTHLANRSLFEDQLNTAIQASDSNHLRVLLLYIDLDEFKPINDEWGHDTGDNVLKIVATRLQASTRETDTVARLGGDEFAIVFPNLDPTINIDQLTELIHERVTQPIQLHGRHINIGCSIGISSYPEDALSASKLWQRADNAMYTAKRNGRRWHHYNDNSGNDASALDPIES